jgi:triosephosphate isomerase
VSTVTVRTPGEYTAEMLHSSGVTHVIIGHSERRDRFGESFEVVRSKVNQAIGASLHVLLCCGESLEVRESEEHFELISKQLKDALADVDSAKMANITIAYEPVWAIGTGVTASADQAQEMHRFIREQLGNWFNPQVASTTRILYGGSCKPSNAAEIFGQPDVNGGLIGGAALEASSFLSLVAASEAS